MTLYRGEPIAEFVARMSADAGLPPKCSDPAILGRIARDLVEGHDALPSTSNGTGAIVPRSRCSSLTTTTPDPHPANPQGEDRDQE